MGVRVVVGLVLKVALFLAAVALEDRCITDVCE